MIHEVSKPAVPRKLGPAFHDTISSGVSRALIKVATATMPDIFDSGDKQVRGIREPGMVLQLTLRGACHHSHGEANPRS